ncbi:toprim domain-containing protein [Escherichia coli]|uniref:toprim domain-containing protein n=1 Tax=Escherichia coli TaxID=562 RepID=UPI003984C001
MNTKKAAIGRWAEIYKHFGLPGVTGKKHWPKECPVCGRKGKFRCDDKDGTGSYICVCGSGDGWALLAAKTGKEFKVLASEVDSLIGNEYTSDRTTINPARTSLAQQREKVSRKFAKLTLLRGTGAEGYLKDRGINALPVESIRYCDKQPVDGKNLQAIYALATDDKGELCYLHRTLLDGEKKAQRGGSAKKMMKLQEDSYLEYAKSVAIRLFPVASTLGIAEGIETALSCHQITKCHTWATMNTAFMKKFRVPAGVKNLIIFADADANAAGHAAAFECAAANLHAKNDLESVSVRWPAQGDFNDLLNNGSEVYEWVFHRGMKQ